MKSRIQIAVLIALVGVLAFLWWPAGDPDRKLIRTADKLFNEQLMARALVFESVGKTTL